MVAQAALLVDAARLMGRAATFDKGQSVALAALRRLDHRSLSPGDCCLAINVCGYYAVGEDLLPPLLAAVLAAPVVSLSAASALHAVEGSGRWGLAASGDCRLLRHAVWSVAEAPTPAAGVVLPAAVTQVPAAPADLDYAAGHAFRSSQGPLPPAVLWRVAATAATSPGWPLLSAAVREWVCGITACSADVVPIAARVYTILGPVRHTAGLAAVLVAGAHHMTLHCAVQTAEALTVQGCTAAGGSVDDGLLRVVLLRAGQLLVAAAANLDTVRFAQRWLLCSLTADSDPQRRVLDHVVALLRGWPAFAGPLAGTVGSDPQLLHTLSRWGFTPTLNAV